MFQVDTGKNKPEKVYIYDCMDGWMNRQMVTTNYMYSSMLYTKTASWNPVFLTQIMSGETDYYASSLRR